MDQTTTTGHKIPDKLFYKATEVCQITDTQPYVLRFWESEFPQLASEKNRSGQRVYRRQDIDLVFRIKKLLYQEEYTIAGARKAIDEERTTIVEPPSKSRSKRTAPAVDEIEPAPMPAAPAPASLFGESRPESPETPSPIAEEESHYRVVYEETLSALTAAKEDLVRSESQLGELRERNRRLAARLEAAIES